MKDIFIKKMSGIRDETFRNINDYGRQTIIKMEGLWLKIFGENEEIYLERYETIQRHINSLFDDMVKEETENFEERRRTLEDLIEMSKELSRELSMDIKLPQINLDGINLRKQIRDVQAALEDFRKIKEERLCTLNKYKAEEEAVCERLGEIPLYSSLTEVPSEAKLKEIKARIVNLNSDKLKRTKSFKVMISEIQELIADLEAENDLTFQQKMILENLDDIVLSTKQMEDLLEWKKELIEEKDNQEKLIESIKEKTTTLWNRLDVRPEEREDIVVRTYRGCGKSVVKIWCDEYDRCEHLKIANIKEVILRIRDSITKLWDECHMDEEERKSFPEYFDDDFNEELLELHEKEESRLCKFYEETKDLYALAEKWFSLWNKMLQLEDRSTNVKRLNNRGGQLLKEEKERKAVQKELPKVESKLEKLITQFENSHKKPFLYDGAPLMEVISSYWENRRMEKENEKEFRKIQNQTRLTPLKCVSRFVPASPVSVNRKRGAPLTPIENTSSKRANTAVKRELKMDKPVKKEAIRRRSRSHDPSRRNDESRVLRSNSANSSAVSYNGFQDYLEVKNRTATYGMPLRSSTSPTPAPYGSTITTKNTSSLFKTPTSVLKSATKRTRLNTYGASKILRPMIN